MTSISKNLCIDKLAIIINKYNNTYNSTIEVKPVNGKTNTYINSCMGIGEMIWFILNLRLVAIKEYRNIKMFL